jgi:hypothetical protein
VSAGEFAHPPGDDRSFAAFVAALPDVLAARDFRAVVDAVVHAARAKRGVVAMLGGHVVKTGLAPLVIDLMRRRVITHVAMNGSWRDSRLRDGALWSDVGGCRRWAEGWHVWDVGRDWARDERRVRARHEVRIWDG